MQEPISQNPALPCVRSRIQDTFPLSFFSFLCLVDLFGNGRLSVSVKAQPGERSTVAILAGGTPGEWSPGAFLGEWLPTAFVAAPPPQP